MKTPMTETERTDKLNNAFIKRNEAVKKYLEKMQKMRKTSMRELTQLRMEALHKAGAFRMQANAERDDAKRESLLRESRHQQEQSDNFASQQDLYSDADDVARAEMNDLLREIDAEIVSLGGNLSTPVPRGKRDAA